MVSWTAKQNVFLREFNECFESARQFDPVCIKFDKNSQSSRLLSTLSRMSHGVFDDDHCLISHSCFPECCTGGVDRFKDCKNIWIRYARLANQMISEFSQINNSANDISPQFSGNFINLFDA